MATGNSRSPAELEEAAAEQIRFLRASCEAYDGGFRPEAKRIASAAYILLHDGGQQKSLLRRIGLRDSLRFISSSDPRCGYETYVPLATWSIPDEGGHFIPDFEIIKEARSRLKRESYSSWIEGKMFVNKSGKELSRKNLMFSLRNQDGGGHVDDKLRNKSYRWLMMRGSDNQRVPRQGGFSYLWDPAKNPSALVDGRLDTSKCVMLGDFVKDGHLAIMRAIGWEISETLSEAGW